MKTHLKKLTFTFWCIRFTELILRWIVLAKPITGLKKFLQSLPRDFFIDLVDQLKIARNWKYGKFSSQILSISGKYLGTAHYNGLYQITLPELKFHGIENDYGRAILKVEMILKENGWNIK